MDIHRGGLGTTFTRNGIELPVRDVLSALGSGPGSRCETSYGSTLVNGRWYIVHYSVLVEKLRNVVRIG